MPIPRARRIAGADTVGEEMDQDHPGPAESFQRPHKAPGSGTRGADENLVTRADNGHRVLRRDQAAVPVGCRLEAHAARHT